MTNCSHCGGSHLTAFFRPQDSEFVRKGALPNEDPHRDWLKILNRFIAEAQRLEERIRSGNSDLGTIMYANRIYDVISHIRFVEDESDGLY